MILVTSFIGWLLFSILAGVGFVALPIDLFIDYKFRPKPIDQGNFDQNKKLLLEYALELRENGKKLDQNRNHVNRIRGYEGWRARYKFSSQLRTWETNCMRCETEFVRLD